MGHTVKPHIPAIQKATAIEYRSFEWMPPHKGYRIYYIEQIYWQGEFIPLLAPVRFFSDGCTPMSIKVHNPEKGW